MDKPDVSPGARDAAVAAKADLGVVGRLRMKIAAVFFAFGMILLPASIRESTSDMTLSDEDE
jgi:hypothetical protein